MLALHSIMMGVSCPFVRCLFCCIEKRCWTLSAAQVQVLLARSCETPEDVAECTQDDVKFCLKSRSKLSWDLLEQAASSAQSAIAVLDLAITGR